MNSFTAQTVKNNLFFLTQIYTAINEADKTILVISYETTKNNKLFSDADCKKCLEDSAALMSPKEINSKQRRTFLTPADRKCKYRLIVTDVYLFFLTQMI